jgi:hypothetical protein
LQGDHLKIQAEILFASARRVGASVVGGVGRAA